MIDLSIRTAEAVALHGVLDLVKLLRGLTATPEIRDTLFNTLLISNVDDLNSVLEKVTAELDDLKRAQDLMVESGGPISNKRVTVDQQIEAWWKQGVIHAQKTQNLNELQNPYNLNSLAHTWFMRGYVSEIAIAYKGALRQELEALRSNRHA